MTPLVLALDLGTTNLKAGLFDREGRMRSLQRVAWPWRREDRRCEMPPDTFWALLHRAIAAALAEAKAVDRDIQAVSYATQANTFLLVDSQTKPITPILCWQDDRAGGQTEALAELCGLDRFAAISGMGVAIGTELAPVKVDWIRRNQPEVWSRVDGFLTISDYLVWGLTGRRVGDCGSAALLGLLDARRGQWRPEALAAVGLSAEQMVRLVRPTELLGTIDSNLPADLPLPVGIPLVAGSMDHHVAALGAGVEVLGECSASTGTAVACAAPSDRYEPSADVCVAPGLGSGYFNMTFSANGTAVLDWYHRTYAPDASLAGLLDAASAVPPGCDGLRAAPCAHLHDGLGSFEGREPRFGDGHYVRAILESVARSQAHCLDALPTSRSIRHVLATGGGAQSDLWMGLQASAFGRPFVRPNCPEPASRGAAMLAAVAIGWYNTLSGVCAAWARLERLFAAGKPPQPT